MGCGASSKKYEKGTDDNKGKDEGKPEEAAKSVSSTEAAKPTTEAKGADKVVAEGSLEATKLQVKDALERGIKDGSLLKDKPPAAGDKPPAAGTPAAAATPAALGTPAPAGTPAAEASAAATPTPAAGKASEEEEEDEEDEEEMDEEEFERMVQKTQTSRKSRAAIAAENIERDADWTAPEHEKTPEQEARLANSLSKCFMFAALDKDALANVIRSFEEVRIGPGTTAIKQGHEVSPTEPALFVIESGRLSVFKAGIEDSVFTYTQPGQYFGDLAVLYNAPRAATVIADEDSVLWAIDRNTFNFLVKDAAKEGVQRRLEFLNSIEFLNGLSPDEKATICEALQVQNVDAGTQIIQAGEVSTDFYIIESGKCEARKDGAVVLVYEAKNYFGELALLSGAPRKADVFAVENSKLLVLGAETFKRMLGPLEDLLRDRAGSYEGINLEDLTKKAA